MTLAGSLFTETWRRHSDPLNAVAVTLLRPSKLKWQLGSFGTFEAPERIFARIVNLCRLGPDSSIYWSGLFNRNDPLQFTRFDAGSEIVAHGAQSVLSYVLASDVAAVRNPSATLARMMEHVQLEAALTHIQNKVTTATTASTIETITPGSNGSIVLQAEGQGYEVELVATVSAVNYVAPALATKGSLTADGVNDQWLHHWYGAIPLFLPIAATMDAKTFAWGARVYSGFVNYNGFVNMRVAELPDWWDDDVLT